jgi:hypothetical protein
MSGHTGLGFDAGRHSQYRVAVTAAGRGIDRARRRSPLQAQHLAQQDRAERRHRDPDRDAGALAAEGVVGDRETLRLPRLADRRGAGPDLVVLGAGDAHPGEVALDVRGETGYAVRGELLGQQLQGLGLAGAGRAGHESVPVEHAERDLDADVGQVVASSIRPPSSSAGRSNAYPGATAAAMGLSVTGEM